LSTGERCLNQVQRKTLRREGQRQSGGWIRLPDLPYSVERRKSNKRDSILISPFWRKKFRRKGRVGKNRPPPRVEKGKGTSTSLIATWKDTNTLFCRSLWSGRGRTFTRPRRRVLRDQGGGREKALNSAKKKDSKSENSEGKRQKSTPETCAGPGRKGGRPQWGL